MPRPSLAVLLAIAFSLGRVDASEALSCRLDLPAGDPRASQVCGPLYSDASPFNHALPDRPALLRRSDQVVRRTVGFGPPPRFVGGASGTAHDWGHPIFFSRRSDPVFTVHCTMAAAWGRCSIEGKQVRIPDAARPTASDDGHMAVIDLASGWEYDFWQVRQKPVGGGRLVVGYGGKTRARGPRASGLGSGATAAGFALAAGVIRPRELWAGRIEHALFMTVKCTNGTSVWPAGGGAGRSCAGIGLPNAGAPAMGQRFYLDMSEAQIDALRQPAWRKAILRAMARYGLFVGDTGGDGWGIVVESGVSQTSFGLADPWVSLGRRFGVPSDSTPSTQRRYFRFHLGQPVRWATRLKAVRICVSTRRCR